MSSESADTPPPTTVIARPTRDTSVIATGWWEMLTNAHKVPCMGKALGYGGVGGVFTGSAFDGWVLGFMVTSTAIFVNCRMQFERELTLAKQLMVAQSRPVSTQELLEAEKAHHQRMTTLGESAAPSNKSESL